MPVWLWLLVWVVVLAALVAGYVLRPVWQHQGREVGALERQRSELLARQETVLTALRELDLDYAVGKLPDEVYQTQRAALLKEGAQVLRELDAVEAQLGAVSPADDDVDQRLEVLLEQRRREQARVALTEQGRWTSPDTDESVDDVLEDLLLARRQARRGRFTGFCPHCGAPYMENDRFCGKCGQPLHGATARRKRRTRPRR